MWDSAEWRGVIFASDRAGAALRRRERCLELAGLAYTTLSERRPSGTYYKLCVREQDLLDAHFALQMAGLCRSLRVKRQRWSVPRALGEFTQDVLDEVMLLLSRLFGLVRDAPHLLLGPLTSSATN